MTGALNWSATQTIASATTTDIGAATSNSVIVSGTTPSPALAPSLPVRSSCAIQQRAHAHAQRHIADPAGLRQHHHTAAGDVATLSTQGCWQLACTNQKQRSAFGIMADPTAARQQTQHNVALGNHWLR